MKHLSITIGPITQAHAEHGENFLDARDLGWPDKEVFKTNLTTFLSVPRHFKYVWSSQCVHTPEEKEFKEATTQVLEKVRWATGNFEDAFLGFNNFVLNSSVIDKSLILNHSLTYKAQSVAIVGAGPSLDSQLTELKKYKGLVIAVDAAAQKLEKEGINYHIVFSTERGPKTAATLEGLSYTDRLLICPYVIHPDSLKAWKGEVCFYASAALPYSHSIFPAPSIILSSPVVGNSAILAAANQGLKNIGLFGYDFTYDEHGKSHTEVHENVLDFQETKQLTVPTYGGEGTTNFVWHSAALSLSTVLNVLKEKPSISTFSKGMISIPGIKYQDAQKWRVLSKPGFDITRLKNPWSTTKKLDLIKENLKEKPKLSNYKSLFEGPAGQVIRMLTLRAFIRFESFMWSDEENKDKYEEDFRCQVSQAISELKKIL